MRDLGKVKKSLNDLDRILKYFKSKASDSNPFIAPALAKVFEVTFEYAWKALKDHVNESGLEAFSPRDVIKAAGQMGAIESVEAWLGFLEDRNLSVHDYIGVDEESFQKNIRDFARELKILVKKLE
mgnify:CR=1 FL=1